MAETDYEGNPVKVNNDYEGNPIGSYTPETPQQTQLPTAAPKDEYSQIAEMLKTITQPRTDVSQVTPAEQAAIKAQLPGAVPIPGQTPQQQPQQAVAGSTGLDHILNAILSSTQNTATTNAKAADNSAISAVQAAQNATATSAAQKSGGSSGGGGGGAGSILNAVSSIASIASIVGWIICTELMKQGKMPRKWWIKGASVFAKYPEPVKQGYYLWAIPCVKHLRNYPNSWFSRLLCIMFNARAKSIAEKPSIQGITVTVILWPICYFLGLIVMAFKIENNWKGLYNDTRSAR